MNRIKFNKDGRPRKEYTTRIAKRYQEREQARRLKYSPLLQVLNNGIKTIDLSIKRLSLHHEK